MLADQLVLRKVGGEAHPDPDPDPNPNPNPNPDHNPNPDPNRYQLKSKGMKGRGGRQLLHVPYAAGVFVHLDLYDDRLFQLQVEP